MVEIRVGNICCVRVIVFMFSVRVGNESQGWQKIGLRISHSTHIHIYAHITDSTITNVYPQELELIMWPVIVNGFGIC